MCGLATLTVESGDEVDAYTQLALGVASYAAEAKGGVTATETATTAKPEEAMSGVA